MATIMQTLTLINEFIYLFMNLGVIFISGSVLVSLCLGKSIYLTRTKLTIFMTWFAYFCIENIAPICANISKQWS